MTNEEKQIFLSNFGETVKHYRNLKGWTLEELATRIGYTSNSARSSVSRIEKGENDLPLSKVKMICSVLGIPVEEIMGWKQVKQSNVTTCEQYDQSEIDLLNAYRNADSKTQRIVRDLLDLDDEPSTK